MALAVEDVNLRFFGIVETLLWEVFRRTLKFHLLDVSDDFSLLGVIDKMAVHKSLILEDIDENLRVGDKAACHTWIWEVSVAHGVIIQIEELVNLELILLNLGFSPRFLAKRPEPIFTVIVVADGVSSTISVLFHLFAFDVLIFSSANFLFECEIARVEIILFDPALCIILFCNC